MNSKKGINRFFEVIPGAFSWVIILSMIAVSIFKPVIGATLIIIFDFYWIIRTFYLTTLLVMAYRKLFSQKDRDWLGDCKSLSTKLHWEKIYHLVIFPIYKEGPEILSASLEALRLSSYPKEKMIVVLTFEERNANSREIARALENEFSTSFFAYISTFHPDGLPGEARIKGANATWAAKHAKEFLASKKIPLENTIVSCFDADTCVEKQYFGCLTYHFLTSKNPLQASYQLMPVYNNNIWNAPSFARLVEISASFCQMIESMRLEKFVTFSSHSMSFKTLVDIDYWPVDMISDDSVIYWKAFLYFNGDYRVIPLYITVSMDVAYGRGLFKTITVQYKQKRRWAWGVENYPFLMKGFLRENEIPFMVKIKRSFNLLEGHVSWAVWAFIITFIAPLPILVGGALIAGLPIGYNLPRVTGLILHFTIFVSLIWVLFSRILLPQRPKDVHWFKNVIMVIEWVFVPIIILILGSTPALDAQTRLMLGKYMEFNPTEKVRKVV